MESCACNLSTQVAAAEGSHRFQASQEGLASLTHAILHHHEAALVALKALAFKAAWRVDTDAAAAEVGGDPALINVCPRFQKEKRKIQREIREC